MTSNDVLVERNGPVTTVIINRPEARNACTVATVKALHDAFMAFEADDDAKVAVLTGQGDYFCAGADLKEALGDIAGGTGAAPGEKDFLAQASALFATLRNFPKPVIAALNGVTMAGGLELAMCADIVLAAESAKIGDAHANFGVFPGAGGAALLPRLVPQNVANYLLLTGKSLSAAQMHAYGFVNEVHADGELAAAAAKLAQQLASKSPVVLRRMKLVARASLDKSRDDALLHEQVQLREHLKSYDILEGLRAFGEKRAPVFKGY